MMKPLEQFLSRPRSKKAKPLKTYFYWYHYIYNDFSRDFFESIEFEIRCAFGISDMFELLQWQWTILALNLPFESVYWSYCKDKLDMPAYKAKEPVNIQLTAEHEKPLKVFGEAHSFDPMYAINELAGQGYKLSFSFIDDMSAWCVTVTGSERSKHNATYFMSSWSDDLVEAIFMCLYKVEIICKNGTWEQYATNSRWG